MGYDKPDVYYQPEKFGLTQVSEIDWSDGCYRFDMTVVWKHDDGTFYVGHDSGCSCPSPFEDFTSLEDLSELDLDVLRNHVDDYVSRKYKRVDEPSDDDAWEFYQSVARLVRDAKSKPPEAVKVLVPLSEPLDGMVRFLTFVEEADGHVQVDRDRMIEMGNAYGEALALYLNEAERGRP